MMNVFRHWTEKALDLLAAKEASGTVSSDAAGSQPVSEAPAAPPSTHTATPIGSNTPACRAVVISDRAYSSICAETLRRHPLETAGAFLGHRQDGVWYVVEATDPGMDTEHAEHSHRMDDAYMNHVYHHHNRMYRRGLDLLGLWHRHPGSFDRFSTTDMTEVNVPYAQAIGGDAISMLVNIDPNIRLTCYYCKLMPDDSVRTEHVPVFVGDRHFAGTDFLTLIYPDARIQPVTDRSPVYTDKAP